MTMSARVLGVFAVFALSACVTADPTRAPESLAIAPASISFDGHVTGQATDLVFVLVKPPADPDAKGIALRAGDSLRVELPSGFRRNDQAPIREDADSNFVATKGWPQAAVKQVGQYKIFYDPAANAIGLFAERDIAAAGANAPGIKVLHLRGNTFKNPAPGSYPVTVRLTDSKGRTKRAWTGNVEIAFEAPSARLAPTNFHLPPGTNSDYQRVGLNADAPHLLGLLLWGEAGSSLNDVGIAPRDLTRHPRYTGGLLVQDTNGDGRLDAAADRVVGGIIGAAPAGAKGQSATSPIADGRPVLSGQVPVHPKFPAGAGGGRPKPGLLPIRFHTGDKPGLYRPTVELIGGNSYQFTIRTE